MDPAVAAAVLAAALLHAAWHALVKASGDRVVALAGMNLVSGAAAIACLPFVALPAAGAFVVIAVSVPLHNAYKLALARLYSRAELSQGYPLARGLTPVMATLLGFAFLGEIPGAWRLAGILTISAGIAGLLFERGPRPISASGFAAALAVGATVAAYSVLDAYGLRINGDWLGFTAWLIACDSAAFVSYALLTRRRAALVIWRSDWTKTLASGLLGLAAFGVFMWALGRAQVGPVTALRETSVVFAALIGVLFLGERASPARLASVALVMAGAIAIL